MSHVFISYSRDDIEMARKTVTALAKDDFKTWIDWQSIPKGEDWREEIYRGIEEAEVFISLVSQSYVKSKMCTEEVDHAVKNSKRILPIIIQDVHVIPSEKIHPELAKRNWIFCRTGVDDFDQAITEIIKTILVDYEWAKYHTKLLLKSLEWEKTNDKGRLLRGKELIEAEQIILGIDKSRDPQPTELQRDYIFASQKNERRTKGQLITASMIALITIVILSLLAWNQRNSTTNAQSTALFEANAKLTALVEKENAGATLQANKATLQANQVTLQANQQLIQQNQNEINNAKITATANQIETQKQTILSLSSTLSKNASGLIDTDYTKALLLGIESYRILERNGYSEGKFPDTLPPLLQKTQTSLKRSVSSPLQGAVQKVIYSPSGQLMVAVSESLDIWDSSDPINPRHIAQLSSQEDPASDVAFNFDGTKLVAGYWSGQVMLWDVSIIDKDQIIKSQKKLYTSTGNRHSSVKVAFGAKENILAVSSDTSLLLFDISQPAKPLYENSTLHDGMEITNVFFLPKYSNYLVTIGRDHTIQVWSTENPQKLKRKNTLSGRYIDGIAIRADGKYIVTSEKGNLVFFDQSLNVIRDYPYSKAHKETVYSMVFDTMHDRLYTASKDGTIAVWDISNIYATNLPLLKSITGHSNRINTLSFQPQTRIMASGGDDAKIVIWDVTDDPTPAIWQGQSIDLQGIVSTAYSASQNLLAVANGQGEISLWNISDINQPVQTGIIPIGEPISMMSFTPNGKFLFILRGRHFNTELDIWENPTIFWRNITNPKRNYNQYTPFVLNTQGFIVPNNGFVLSAEVDGGTTYSVLWDLYTDPRWPTRERISDITNCSVIKNFERSESGLTAITSCNVEVWDFSEGTTPKQISQLSDTNSPLSVTLNSEGTLLAVGSEDNSISIWSISKNGNTAAISTISDAHVRPVTHVSLISSGATLVSGSDDRDIRVWDTSNPKEPTLRFTLKGTNDLLVDSGLLITKDGKTLISATKNEIIFFDINPESWLQKACGIAGRNFTKAEWSENLPGQRYPTNSEDATCPQFPLEANE
jgi:WD40 repeat protein